MNSDIPSVQTYTYDQPVQITTFVPKRMGYTFLGWSPLPKNGVLYQSGETRTNLTTTPGAIVTLYAIWEEADSSENPLTPILPGFGTYFGLRGDTPAFTGYVKAYTYDISGNRTSFVLTTGGVLLRQFRNVLHLQRSGHPHGQDRVR